jgi:hypothetical protein
LIKLLSVLEFGSNNTTHRPVLEEFSERLTKAVAGLEVGRGDRDGVDVGPLIELDHLGHLRDAAFPQCRQRLGKVEPIEVGEIGNPEGKLMVMSSPDEITERIAMGS